jgi:putative oxygen-independent coproporphyrinogen III oxidase
MFRLLRRLPLQYRRYFSTSKELEPLAVYIHWPYCRDICPYCDFNRYKRDHSQIDHQSLKNTYLHIIDNFFQSQNFNSRKLRSIFFGGGTPSLAEPEFFHSIIDRVHRYISAYPKVEITMEANPTSLEMKKLAAFRNAGINRISIGVQSLHEQDLKFLGRKHTTDEAMNAIKQASSIFDRVSLDLMFGTALHARNPQIWDQTLKKALELGTNHISLYQLTIEKNTK